MDLIDRGLLNFVQASFPIAHHPYQVLGDLVGCSETEALERIERFRQEGIIRRLGGVFDSRRLGYFSTLCAAKVPVAKISSVAKMLDEIPGVTHNYLRNHDYNMWFTLIAPSETKAEEVLAEIRQTMAIQEIHSLPAIRLFKINVDFDFNEGLEETEEAEEIFSADDPALVTDQGLGLTEIPNEDIGLSDKPPGYSLTEADIELVRLLQADLPYGPTPFYELAMKLGRTEDKVIDLTNNLLDVGAIRRFGAVLRHQKAGFVSNAMGVWQAPPERANQLGEIMAGFRAVSHCYQRPTLPDWPYNLFTMIHGRSQEDCRKVMEEISEKTGLREYSMLFSTKELKKSSMQYFL